jgi:MFS transporter, DHA3 family, macrolide efflux protein
MESKQKLRTFYILLLTQTFSLIGSRMTGFAVGIRVFNDTGDVTPLALVGFFSAVPMLLSASLAGVLADRWDRRYVMVLADAGQAVATLLLLLSFAAGVFQLWHLYVLTIIESGFGIFQRPAFEASITMLVPDKHRDRANAIQQLTRPASGVIAPTLAGILFAFIGATGVMALDLFTFGVAITVVLLVHIPRPEQTAEGRAMQGNVWQAALVGMRYLWSKRPLFWLIVSASTANFLLVGAMILNTPYVLSITGSEAILGTLMGVMSAGPVLGGVLMGIWGGTRPRIHTILPGIALEGVFLAIYGVTRHPVAMGLAVFFILFPIPFVNASFMSLLQVKIPPDLQGRVFSAVTQVSIVLTPLAYLVAGPLADKVFEPAVGGAGWEVVAPLVGSQAGSGMGLIMVIYGVLAVANGLIFYAIPYIRSVESSLPDYKPVEAVDDEDEGDEAAADDADLAGVEPAPVA